MIHSAGANVDVIVIGGGVMGLFTANKLAEAGVKRIVVLEKRHVGAGSSGKSGAILRQHYSHEVTIRMARESLFEYRDFQKNTGCDIGFVQTGMLFVCGADGREAVERNVVLQKSLGVDVELLNVQQLRKHVPDATFPDDALGALERESGYVSPPLTLDALSKLAAQRGVEVRTHTEVVDVHLNSDHSVRAVALNDGSTIEAPIIVNCGGPWANRLCRRLGLDLPLTTIRPEQAYFQPPAGSSSGAGLIFGDLLNGLYWKPEPAGWTRVGKMAYDGDEIIENPDDYDEGVSDAFIEFTRAQMSQRLPDFRDAVSWGGCGALYTVTPDAHPLVGETPGIGGFYVVSGFSGHGFKLGPAIGRGVAAMITGHDTGSFDPAFFAVDRFDTGGKVGSAYKYGILG